jgi:uncharacterized cupin superfamily protein
VPVSDPNVHEPEWEVDATDTPSRMRAARVGAPAGAHDLAASVYEVLPGGAVAPYHLHHGNEELLVVLSGAPRLRTPQGTRDLTPGAVVSFRPGPDGAHRVSNPTSEPVRVLLISTMRFPEVAEYPDTGTTLTLTAPGAGTAFPAGTAAEFRELYQQAIAADLEADAAQDS